MKTLKRQPELTESEWALVLRILEAERDRTINSTAQPFRRDSPADFHERLHMLHRLIDQVREAALD